MELLLVMLIAVSLNMDAFSLSLAYGTFGVSRRVQVILSMIVGIFHFFMPLLGLVFGGFVFDYLNINSDFLVCIVLVIIGLDMIYESFKGKEEFKGIKIIEMILFGFAVSVDSFTVGFTLPNIYSNYVLCAVIFAIFSFSFTFVGVALGNKIQKSVGRISTIIGGVILALIGMFYFVGA